MSYRIYLTDAVQAIGQDKYPQERWITILTRKPDTRTGDEIAAEVIRSAGLVLGGENE